MSDVSHLVIMFKSHYCTELLLLPDSKLTISFLYPCRNVYEGPDPPKFEERLDSRIKNHDREIERMCNYHYQGFIESVRGLLQVRSDVENLKVRT